MEISPGIDLGESIPPTAAGELRRSWRVLVAAMLGLGFSGGASLYWFGVLISPLSREFGWSNSAMSGWAILVHITTFLLGPLAGILVDRIGARTVALWSIPLVALGFTTVGLTMHTLGMLYLGAIIVGASNSCLTTFTRAINTWFDAGRGLALGLAYSGAGLTSMLGPRLTLYVVDSLGWRAGFVFMGAMTLIPFPAVYFWLREHRHAVGSEAAAPESGFRMREVLHLSAFWFVGLGGALYFLAFNGVQFNLIPFLTSGGLSRASAADYAGLMGVFILVGKLVAGAALDRLRAAFLIAGFLLADAAALTILALWQSHGAIPALVVIGFVQGAMMNGLPYCVARYFGIKFFAGIFGLISVLLAVSAFGAFLFSFLRDISHSYSASLFVASGLLLGAAVLLACLGFRPYFAGGLVRAAGSHRTFK